jgi:hypothetical protein
MPSLVDLEHLMDLAFAEIAYCEYQRSIIPCGYVGHWDYGNSFILRYSKEEQAYLKNNYALHHELYLYEQRMLSELDTLRNLYENMSDDIFVKEAMNRSLFTFETICRPVIGGEDLFDDDAFGETFDWIH